MDDVLQTKQVCYNLNFRCSIINIDAIVKT